MIDDADDTDDGDDDGVGDVGYGDDDDDDDDDGDDSDGDADADDEDDDGLFYLLLSTMSERSHAATRALRIYTDASLTSLHFRLSTTGPDCHFISAYLSCPTVNDWSGQCNPTYTLLPLTMAAFWLSTTGQHPVYIMQSYLHSGTPEPSHRSLTHLTAPYGCEYANGFSYRCGFDITHTCGRE